MPPVISLQPTASIHLAGDLMEERKCYFQCVRYLSLKTVKNIKVILPPVVVCASIARWISVDHIQCAIHFYSILLLFEHRFTRSTHLRYWLFLMFYLDMMMEQKIDCVCLAMRPCGARDVRPTCILSINYLWRSQNSMRMTCENEKCDIKLRIWSEWGILLQFLTGHNLWKDFPASFLPGQIHDKHWVQRWYYCCSLWLYVYVWKPFQFLKSFPLLISLLKRNQMNPNERRNP